MIAISNQQLKIILEWRCHCGMKIMSSRYAFISGRYGYSYPWELGKIIQIAAESTVSVMPSLIAAQCKAYNNRAPQGL